MPEQHHHISSAVVIARRDGMAAVSTLLAAMEGVELHAAEGGKIVVVIEGPSVGFLGDRLLEISAMRDVIAAHMVFEQAIVEQEMSDDGRTHAA